ncbi:hypothetical protein GCM10011374_09670 [Kocuria dechangensis]|uniref:Anti-sigma K factor RskA C-terminal domain-containing protein n=1 Tax=Kocuria dechangensis TaxID=1176249 RepID=A0A917GK31_9MICC|nr:anti-sigma factor [Kocuria dechangensis]GGG49280.1 hypothetical protein GCM10011374_09670 [Kocuria dechangensis]
MAHLSEESLALLALGEPLDAQSQDHLADCPDCTAEVESLRHVVLAGRAEPPAPAAPGPQVWAAIHAGLGLSEDVAEDPFASPRGAAPDGAETNGAEKSGTVHNSAGTAGAGSDAGAGAGSRSAVVDLDARRRRPRRGVPYPLAAAAAAAALLAGAGAMWAVQRPGAEPAPTLVARAELEPLAGYTARGAAEVDVRPDGTRQLVVRTDPADVDGFKEVWLLAPDATGMISLGVMAGDEAVFVLPENVDVSQFPVVDVSNEPVDGDPTHSGDSIVRGTLEA